ncbi:MAG: DUF4830 domain-containing protein [Clostridia bacterium]|nr:DUF4830 domain-containing protein [Clostridia bacterium]
MKKFIKENLVTILLVLLLGLLFILWGRIVVKGIRENTYMQNLTTTEARIRCLAYYGWQADPGSETERKVHIPKPLDSVYLEYNKLQKVCGFNLEDYAGQSAENFSYQVENFPYAIEEPVYVNILISEGKLIGGDCMSNAIDGFMLPIDRKYLP